MESNAVALAALALTTTIAGGFFALINKQNKTHEKIAEAMNKVAKSNVEIVKSNYRIADETKQGNKEAKERNGHLAELVVQTNENTLEAIKNVEGQHVTVQTVEAQVVKKG